MLPANFAELLASALERGAESGAADVIRRAAALDDIRLACFLREVTALVRGSARPLTVGELEEALERCR